MVLTKDTMSFMPCLSSTTTVLSNPWVYGNEHNACGYHNSIRCVSTVPNHYRAALSVHCGLRRRYHAIAGGNSASNKRERKPMSEKKCFVCKKIFRLRQKLFWCRDAMDYLHESCRAKEMSKGGYRRGMRAMMTISGPKWSDIRLDNK